MNIQTILTAVVLLPLATLFICWLYSEHQIDKAKTKKIREEDDLDPK